MNSSDKNDGLQMPIKSRAFYVHRGRESSLLHPEHKLWKIKLNKVGRIIAKLCLNQTKVCLNGWLKHLSERAPTEKESEMTDTPSLPVN